MNPNNENSNQNAQQVIKTSKVLYSIVTRTRTPIVKPGGKLEIEIFLTGYGLPEKNKLCINWSSPYIIDKKDTGIVTSCIGVTNAEVTGELKPVPGHIQTQKVVKTGVIIILNKGNFLKVPSQLAKIIDAPFKFDSVMSEYLCHGNPPILISINIDKNAPSGDYDITLALTYGDEKNVMQDFKTVSFHITSWWERNQKWVVPLGVIIAFASLLISALGTIYRLILDP